MGACHVHSKGLCVVCMYLHSTLIRICDRCELVHHGTGLLYTFKSCSLAVGVKEDDQRGILVSYAFIPSCGVRVRGFYLKPKVHCFAGLSIWVIPDYSTGYLDCAFDSLSILEEGRPWTACLFDMTPVYWNHRYIQYKRLLREL